MGGDGDGGLAYAPACPVNVRPVTAGSDASATRSNSMASKGMRSTAALSRQRGNLSEQENQRFDESLDGKALAL